MDLRDALQVPSVKAELEAGARGAREAGWDRASWILMLEGLWDVCNEVERDELVALGTEAYDNADDEPLH